MWSTGLLHWVRDLDYGNVPGWVGAGSLLLAYRVFLRDRITAQRNQVDLVGVWMKTEWEQRMFPQPRVEEGSFTLFLRNGSHLPVRVEQVAYEFATSWWVRDLAQWTDEMPIWSAEPGTGVVQMYLIAIEIPPDETRTVGPQKFNFAHLAPEHADQLDFAEGRGISYRIRWVLIADNANRRWEVQPGRRTRRLRWYSRRRRDYPLHWQHRITWLMRRLPHWLKEQHADWRAGRRARVVEESRQESTLGVDQDHAVARPSKVDQKRTEVDQH